MIAPIRAGVKPLGIGQVSWRHTTFASLWIDWVRAGTPYRQPALRTNSKLRLVCPHSRRALFHAVQIICIK